MVASLKDSPQCIAVYRIVGLTKVNEAHVERLVELPCLLHEDSLRVNLVVTATTFAETALALTEKKFNMWLQTVGNDLREDLAGNTQQGDTTEVVTVRLTALLVNGHNKLLCPVTGNRLLCPNGGKDRGQPTDRGLPTKLEHFTRDPSRPGAFPFFI